MTNCWFGGQWHDDASFYPCTLALLVRSSPFHILLVAAAAAAFAAPATLLHFLRNLWAFAFTHFTVNLNIIIIFIFMNLCGQSGNRTRIFAMSLKILLALPISFFFQSLRLIDFCACICECMYVCTYMHAGMCARCVYSMCVCGYEYVWEQATECVRMAVRSFCLWAAFYYEHRAQRFWPEYANFLRYSYVSRAQRSTHLCMYVCVFVCPCGYEFQYNKISCLGNQRANMLTLRMR